jgi:hypothetical protein
MKNSLVSQVNYVFIDRIDATQSVNVTIEPMKSSVDVQSTMNSLGDYFFVVHQQVNVCRRTSIVIEKHNVHCQSTITTMMIMHVGSRRTIAQRHFIVYRRFFLVVIDRSILFN